MIDHINAKLSLPHMLGMKPGDLCPGAECDGTIATIEFRWFPESFHAEAICGKCGGIWTLLEEHEEPVREPVIDSS